ncbi:MAG: DUF1351 domain-containing protein [Lentimicrobiaceae bacterium]|jgi:hypothetical protein|nr:DUF1351 domain-containing protein [Lentimicrobiaceae bacterium]
MQENQIMRLVTAPQIEQHLKDVGKAVSKRIEELNLENQIVTDETIKALKDTRALLNKEAEEFERQRKAIKAAILLPYEEFEAIFKAEIMSIYKNADEILKNKISENEMKRKQEKKNTLVAYFKGVCQSYNIDWLKFEDLKIEIGLSVTEKKYKEQINEFLEKVSSDIKLIESEEFAPEIMTDYKTTLSASTSISKIRERKAKEKFEQERLLHARTDKRKEQLHKISLVYHDFTNSYNSVKDENIMISLAEIESLNNDEWTKKFIELEIAVKALEKPLESPTVEDTMSAEKEVKQEKKPQLFKAKFEILGTYEELTALQTYLKEKNLNYKRL